MKTEDQNLIIKKTNNMQYLPIFGIMFIVVGFISWRWVVGIDYMKENHPDSKGDDFLNWGKGEENDDDKNQIM